jgi:hypothetical protein
MPRLVHKLPSYRLHKPSGQAVVTLAGKVVYVGPTASLPAVPSTTEWSPNGK